MEKVNLKCFVEGCNNKLTAFDNSGVPYCEDHWAEMADTSKKVPQEEKVN